MKWRISKFGSLPEPFIDKLLFLIKLVFDPFIFSSLLSAFIASLFWMAAMTKFNISYAYPFMSFSYVLVFIFSIFIFKEPITIYKMVGLIFIVIGIIISSRSIS
ncbi:EamA family transporter [Paenibacillus macerans]|uniref:EamA family transporter n=1 Tax=Paenibacillus macerans TaxID=44252 RepID=UPI002DBD5C6A|nr:EamA family transporter [Paenibacillus macerans]MEC0140614.1 EamA family transporter [Paenibacillus macerans]